MPNFFNTRIQHLILTGTTATPTIPNPSTINPSSSGWTSTDIMHGEWAYNLDDDLWYYRDKNNIIKPFEGGGSVDESLFWKTSGTTNLSSNIILSGGTVCYDTNHSSLSNLNLIHKQFADTNYWKTVGTTNITGSGDIKISRQGDFTGSGNLIIDYDVWQDSTAKSSLCFNSAGQASLKSEFSATCFGCLIIASSTATLVHCSGSNRKSFSVTPNGIYVIDCQSKGIEYFGNYTGLTNCSLIHKQFADANYIPKTGVVTVDSLNIEADTNTNISLQDKTGNLAIGVLSHSDSMTEGVAGFFGSEGLFIFDKNNVFGYGNGIQFIDTRATPLGIEYNSNYTTLSNCSLIHKQYADGRYLKYGTNINERIRLNVTNAYGSIVYDGSGSGADYNILVVNSTGIVLDSLNYTSFEGTTFQLRSDIATFIDSRSIQKGIEYSGNYMALTNCSLIHKQFADGRYWKISGTTNLNPDTETIISVGGNNGIMKLLGYNDNFFEFGQIYIGHSVDGSNLLNGFIFNNVETTYTSSTGGGIKYNDNYTGLTANSLIHKGFADATYAPLSGSSSYNKSTITHSVAGNLELDFNNISHITVTVQADVTGITLVNLPEGVTVTVSFIMDGGDFPLPKPTGTKTIDGIIPDHSIEDGTESFWQIRKYNTNDILITGLGNIL